MKSTVRFFRGSYLVLAAVVLLAGCAMHPGAESVTPPPPSVLTQQEMKKIVVARVNGAAIHMDAVVRMMNLISANTPTTLPPGSRKELRMMALEQVVMRELVLQEATRRGLRVEQRELADAMEYFIKSKGHEAGFQQFLEKEHTTTDEVRAQVEKNLLLQLIVSKEVLKKTGISDEDVRREYELGKDKYISEGRQLSFEEAKGPIERRLKVVAQQKRIGEWEQELKKDAKIEIVETGEGQGAPAGKD